MVTKVIPKSKGTCPECDSRIRQNRHDGVMICENSECDWKQ